MVSKSKNNNCLVREDVLVKRLLYFKNKVTELGREKLQVHAWINELKGKARAENDRTKLEEINLDLVELSKYSSELAQQIEQHKQQIEQHKTEVKKLGNEIKNCGAAQRPPKPSRDIAIFSLSDVNIFLTNYAKEQVELNRNKLLPRRRRYEKVAPDFDVYNDGKLTGEVSLTKTTIEDLYEYSQNRELLNSGSLNRCKICGMQVLHGEEYCYSHQSK